MSERKNIYNNQFLSQPGNAQHSSGLPKASSQGPQGYSAMQNAHHAQDAIIGSQGHAHSQSQRQKFVNDHSNQLPKNIIMKYNQQLGSGNSRNSKMPLSSQDRNTPGAHPIYMTDASVLKKTRRLRKNFDLLQGAVKNSKTTKKEKKIAFIQGDARGASGNNSVGPHGYSTSSTQVLGMQGHSQSLYQQLAEFEDTSSHNISADQLPKHGYHSQSAAVNSPPRQKTCNLTGPLSGNSGKTHFSKAESLYSQISIREGILSTGHSNSAEKKLNPPPSQPRLAHQNQNLIQIINNQQANATVRQGNSGQAIPNVMRINDKLMKKYVNADQSSRSNSSAILNISTASDININVNSGNIYNNSFILNTSGKKQPQTQNQSRSSSLKRGANGQPINQPGYIGPQVKQNPSTNRIQVKPGSNNFSVDNQRLLHTQSQMGSSQGFQIGPNSSNSKLNNTQRGNSTGSGLEGRTKQQAIAEAYTGNSVRTNNSQVVGNLFGKKNSHHQQLMMQVLGNNTNNTQQPVQIQKGSSQRSFQNQRGSFDFRSSDQRSGSSTSILGNTAVVKKQRSAGKVKVNPELQMQEQQRQSIMLLNDGKAKLQQKDYFEAINLFTKSIQIDPDNYDAKFFRAISYLDSSNIVSAISELQEVLQASPQHSQLTFILLSIAYKRSGEVMEAASCLSQCIEKHPDYPDAYLARGQAFLMQEEKFDVALSDFKKYAQLMPKAPAGYLGMGDCLKALNRTNEAIQAYSTAINMSPDECILKAFMKRALAHFNNGDYKLALVDFQTIVKREPKNPKAHFFVGKILARDHTQASDATLHFEQVVKHGINTHELFAGNALFELAKLRLQEKDFYEAYFNLKRATDSNFSSKRMQLYRDFTEGVLYLIKRKIKKGVQLLSDLLEILLNNKEHKTKPSTEYLKHQIYTYRAYGYVAIEKYEMAIEDIKKAKQLKKVDSATLYNKSLGKGILRMDHEDFIMASKYFLKASAKFPSNKDPYCLMIIAIVHSYSYSLQYQFIDQPDKHSKVYETMLFMTKAAQNCDIKSKEPSLHFFKGLLLFHLHQFADALVEFNVAIDEEEEPTASYYLARGRCYACLSILSEAMKDLSIALNLDDSLQEAYINRGKCAYLLGDNNLAFLDFQRLILTDPKNPLVHVYAGNLLMTTGAYQDAIKAFLNADTVRPTAVAAFQRARCHCALTEIDNALAEIEVSLSLNKEEALLIIDKECLLALKKAIDVLNASNKAGTYAKMETPIKQLTQLIVAMGSGLSSLRRKDSPLSIQIIPNVKRIKVEKVQVAKTMMANAEEKDMSLSIDVTQTVDTEALKHIPCTNYYYENIFGIEDFYLYRAICQFYQGNYEKAISDFNTVADMKQDTHDVKKAEVSQTESLHHYSQSGTSTPMLSMHSSKTDLSDVGLCSLNTHETAYNLMLCHLMRRNFNEAKDKLNEILFSCPRKYQKYFYLLRSLVFNELDNNSEKAKKDMQKFIKSDPEMHDSFMIKRQDLVIEPFPNKTRLCSLYPMVEIKLGAAPAKLMARPSFSMPFIKPPNMIPNIDEESLQTEFNLKQIDAPMPEAPWIRRCQHGIKFTDEIQDEEPNDVDIVETRRSAAIQEANSVAAKKHLSEQILQSSTVYFIDDKEAEELSDKHRVSLFDDSKFEDHTIENKCATLGEDDEDSDTEEENSSQIDNRESMVLMGEGRRLKQVPENPLLIDDFVPDEEGQEKEQLFSELESNQSSLFRSRPESHREGPGRPGTLP